MGRPDYLLWVCSDSDWKWMMPRHATGAGTCIPWLTLPYHALSFLTNPLSRCNMHYPLSIDFLSKLNTGHYSCHLYTALREHVFHSISSVFRNKRFPCLFCFAAATESLVNLNLSWNHLRRRGAIAVCRGMAVSNLRIIQLKYDILASNYAIMQLKHTNVP